VEKIKIGLLFLVSILSFNYQRVKAQDAHFSQFYANPLYLNPAYAGSSLRNRVSFNARNQWPQVTEGIITTSASLDGYLPKSNTGIGVSVLSDYISSTGLRSTGLTAHYAYHLPFSKYERLSLGVSAGVFQRSIDFYKFTFEDQLLTEGQITPSQETRNADGESVVYPDLTIGAAYSGKNWYAGLSAAHLNRPSQNNLKASNNTERLPIRYTANAGYKIRISPEKRNFTDRVSESFIIPNVLLKVQQEYHQLNVGVSLQHNYLLAGIYHRSHPLSSAGNKGAYSQDAVIAMLGAIVNDFTFGYSYDYHLNSLSGIRNGSHEVSLILNWKTYPKNKPKRYAPIPCPKI
jgi:type IX secretion system PorP/SprF family membrane protein